MTLITTSSALQNLCQNVLPQETVLYMDTEFQREKTYFPLLSLIQIATQQEIFLIDALEPFDWQPFKDFFQGYAGRIVFFSARQDLETFWHRLGFLPTSIFDVQIALEALGHPPSMGYGAAVETYLGEKLDKSQQYSDWITRPLTQEKCLYAANDVRYLRPLYDIVQKRLSQTPKESWVLEDMAFLWDPKTYSVNQNSVWKKCRLQSQSPRYLLRLQQLATFREQEALRLDKPRGHIISDTHLHEMALKGALSPISSHLKKSVKNLLDICENSCLEGAPQLKAIPAPLEKELKNFGRFACQYLATHYGIYETYLANSAEIESILRGHPVARVAKGWRYDIFTVPLMAGLQQYGQESLGQDRDALIKDIFRPKAI